ARYTTDVRLPGMLHAAILRSPVARGTVTRLDVGPALSFDGVRAVATIDDVPNVTVDGVRLFDQTIYYANQPLAAVCADSLEIAERAASAIILELSSEPPVVRAEQALAQ